MCPASNFVPHATQGLWVLNSHHMYCHCKNWKGDLDNIQDLPQESVFDIFFLLFPTSV
jgi:hypothetical protein